MLKNIFYFIIVFCFSSCITKKIAHQNTYGKYSYKDKAIYLEINKDSSFWFMNKQTNKGCLGIWKLVDGKLEFICKPPPHAGYLIQSFTYIQDSTFQGKIKGKKIVLNKKKLSLLE